MRPNDSYGPGGRRSQADQLRDQRDEHLNERARTTGELTPHEWKAIVEEGRTTKGRHRASPVFPAEAKVVSIVSKPAPKKRGRVIKGLEPRVTRATTVAQETYDIVNASDIGFSRVIELMFMELTQDEERSIEPRTKSGSPTWQPPSPPQDHLYRGAAHARRA